MERSRSLRRLRASLLGLALAAIVVELTLQAVAFVMWASRGDAERPPGSVVLCLGDSLTFGLGAAPDAAYPPRLQAAGSARRPSRRSATHSPATCAAQP